MAIEARVYKLAVLVIVAIAVSAAFDARCPCSPAAAPSTVAVPPPMVAVTLPRLLDLGADKCVPCKMMTPILAELRAAYAGKLRVDFIDVWKDPDAAKAHRVEIIPTQIFFDASGKEVFRHEGFFAKEDILAKWKELGVNLETR